MASPDLSTAHDTAKALRVPVFQRDTPTAEKSPLLEEFMLVSAFWAGELHEERLQRRVELKPKRDTWRDMVGWEGARRGRTNASIDEAKAIFNPELWSEIQDLEWTIDQLTAEIDRLDRDATKCSRAYTIIMGQ